jgi:molecular chaperone GrpE (heat shock protein)
MTPFEEELYRLFQDSKNETTAFTTAAQDAGNDMQKITMFSVKWDYKDRYEKLLKEHNELKDRFEKEKKIIGIQATKTVIKELIPIIDECFMLHKFVEKGSELERAVKLVLMNLEKILTRRKGGIIRPQIGDDADPSKHKFIEAEEEPGHHGNTVSDVYRYGYYVLGQIIREAEIKVKCGIKH